MPDSRPRLVVRLVGVAEYMSAGRELYNVKPLVEILQQKSYNGITHPSIECVEEATQEGPDCNS